MLVVELNVYFNRQKVFTSWPHSQKNGTARKLAFGSCLAALVGLLDRRVATVGFSDKYYLKKPNMLSTQCTKQSNMCHKVLLHLNRGEDREKKELGKCCFS